MLELERDDDLECLGDVADEFLARWRSGEAPRIEDYAERHPALAAEIEALLPVLLSLEQHRESRSERSHGPRSDEARAEPGLPRRLGEYELVREIGRGGMGIVFEARQPALDRRVAIKVLPGNFGLDERARQRFLREGRIIARLRHPGIVPVHALAEEDGVLYYVMDLVRGTSLDQAVPPRAASEPVAGRCRWVAGLGIQAAETLAYAHAQGVLHRDVKPSNFLLDAEGRLWLTDFGLAKILEEPSMTASGQWLGTLRYLAPECLRGEFSERSDVYGLGLTLYELLAGVPAFPESEPDRLLRRITEATPVPPRTLVPSIPRELETIVLKALSPTPEHRYATAHELAEDLKRFLDGRTILARRTGGGVRIVRWIRRNPAIAILAAVATALALIVAGLLMSRTTPLASVEGEPASPAASATAARPEGSAEDSGVAKQGPPWGYGRRHAPMGPGGGAGRGPWGARRGMGPPGR